MSLTSAQKLDIVNQYKRSDRDTGSTEVQVSLITARIKHLTEHFKVYPKDLHSRRGLQLLVSQRRRLLKYLKKSDLARYHVLIKELGLRDTN